jgi:ribose transport system substrate-binding protein
VRDPLRLLRRLPIVLATALLLVTSGFGVASARSRVQHGSLPPGVQLAMKIVQQYEAPPKWDGPTAKVDTKLARGKSVDLINLTEEIPALHEWAAVAQQELQQAGVHVNICDAQGSPTGIVDCLQQAISLHPNVIVAMALDTAFIHKYIEEANARGIKVITAQTGTPGIPHGTGAVAEVSFPYPEVGRILAAWFAASSHCQGSYPQIITSTSSRQPSAAEVNGIQSELHRLCPNLKPIPVQNVLIPNWPTQLPTLMRSDIISEPNVHYYLPLYDGMTIYMLPAVRQANAWNKVSMASFNGTPVVMAEVAKSPLKADIGGPNDWYGFALADQVFRVLTGAKVVADEHVPLRLFDATNIGTINIKAPEYTWYGTVNFRADYEKLWGFPVH